MTIGKWTGIRVSKSYEVLKQNAAKKGDFVSYVTSANENEFPDNGQKGSYWYIKQ